MATVDVNGAKIWYQLAGNGPPLMQVPGAATGHEGYALVTSAMLDHFTVLDYDEVAARLRQQRPPRAGLLVRCVV